LIKNTRFSVPKVVRDFWGGQKHVPKAIMDFQDDHFLVLLVIPDFGSDHCSLPEAVRCFREWHFHVEMVVRRLPGDHCGLEMVTRRFHRPIFIDATVGAGFWGCFGETPGSKAAPARLKGGKLGEIGEMRPEAGRIFSL
jgi:hypothetical protein